MPRVIGAAREKSRLTKEEWREYTKTVWRIANTTHAEHPAVFPVEIPHRLIKLFSWHGETVLDPFAGTGTTAAAAVPLGRKVLCIEQNRKYVDIIRRDCSHLKNGNLTAIELMNVVHGDSRDISFIDDDSVSLIVSSPPYWNKADYGSARANLGRVAGYRRFLDKIKPVFEECFRVLQPGRKCCLVTANVNQHTDHGLLTFPLAADFGTLLRNIGFMMVSEIIWSKDGTGGRWGSANAQRPIFGSYPYPPNFLFKNVHEYILVFSKPPARKSRGPKVVPYDELMADARRAGLRRDDGTDQYPGPGRPRAAPCHGRYRSHQRRLAGMSAGHRHRRTVRRKRLIMIASEPPDTDHAEFVRARAAYVEHLEALKTLRGRRSTLAG